MWKIWKKPVCALSADKDLCLLKEVCGPKISVHLSAAFPFFAGTARLPETIVCFGKRIILDITLKNLQIY